MQRSNLAKANLSLETAAKLKQAGIQPARLGGVRPRLLPTVLRLPTPLFRLLAREVAFRHGILLSFLPKPLPAQGGSGVAVTGARNLVNTQKFSHIRLLTTLFGCGCSGA